MDRANPGDGSTASALCLTHAVIETGRYPRLLKFIRQQGIFLSIYKRKKVVPQIIAWEGPRPPS